MCKDVKILHIIATSYIFDHLCMNLQASLVKAQQSLVSEFEDWMQTRVVRLFSSRQISEWQWHFIISLPFLISLPFEHSPSLQSRRKRPEGLIRSLFCLEVWTLVWIAITYTSNCSHVFWTVCGFTFWYVLSHSDTFTPSPATFEKVLCRCF